MCGVETLGGKRSKKYREWDRNRVHMFKFRESFFNYFSPKNHRNNVNVFIGFIKHTRQHIHIETQHTTRKKWTISWNWSDQTIFIILFQEGTFFSYFTSKSEYLIHRRLFKNMFSSSICIAPTLLSSHPRIQIHKKLFAYLGAICYFNKHRRKK